MAKEPALARAQVETKVKAASGTAGLVGAVVAVLNAVHSDPGMLEPLPKWAQTLVLVVVPGALTFLSGYQAPHRPRTPSPPG